MGTFPQCDNCANGDHRLDTGTGKECLSKRDILPVHCGCWCLTPDCRPVRLRQFRPLDAGTVYALDVLRRYHVEVRTRKSNGLLVWKPQPRNMPEEIAAQIKSNRMGLQIALAAWVSVLPAHRDQWTHGTVAACVGCGKGCVARDPLGYVRHPWCGWLGQVPIIEKIVQVPGYPAYKSSAA